MSKLNIDQRNIKDLFQDKKSDFLIPDYQRPYAWTETECQTLWDDLFEFAIPNQNADSFNQNDEYYLGPIVTFTNDDGKLEIIDGQQRLTTLMLLLRAFDVKFKYAQDPNTVKTREAIEKCLWKTDEFGTPKYDELKIDSEVATDNDKDEFLGILRTGETNKNQSSKYAVNYRFFQNQIEEFADHYAMYMAILPMRILNNCILLPIEAEDQGTALRIFSTLNDRGLPLSDADIFKAQFYKYYTSKDAKDDFIQRWKDLEDMCNSMFSASTGSPMDELFTRYMYYKRAQMGINSSTTEALRKFYERDKYSILKQDETLPNLERLAKFWKDINDQNNKRFSERVLKKLCVLNYAPNSMWTYFLSVYFLQYHDENDNLDDNKLYNFLDKTIAFVWTYAVTNPGVNALRTPVFAEMINIVNNQEVTFDRFKFDENNVRASFNNFTFWNQRPVTKSMLTWWAFNNPNQQLLSIKDNYQIEHIYAKNRQNNDLGLDDSKLVESLGNKSLLEERINIRASDYKFEDKKKYYLGFKNGRGQYKEGTNIADLKEIAADYNDFTGEDIKNRYNEMINNFVDYLKSNNLIK